MCGCENPGINPSSGGGGGGGGDKVKVDSSDTTADFLAEKIAAGTGVSISILNAGGDEQLLLQALGQLTINSFAKTGTKLFQCGDSVVNPPFTATYNQTPDSVTLTDTDGNTQVIASPFLSFASTHTYTRAGYGQTVVFTLHAHKTGTTPDPTRNDTLSFGLSNYYGTEIPGGPYNEAFIEALAHSVLAVSRVEQTDLTCGAGEAMFWAFPTSAGTPTFKDANTRLNVDVTLISTTIPVTNGFGVTVNYQLWKSTFTDIGHVVTNVT